MNFWKKAVSAALSFALLLSLSACGDGTGGTSETGGTDAAPLPNTTEPRTETAEEPDPTPAQAAEEIGTEEPVKIRAAALKGPTAMGLVKLMADAEAGDTTFGEYEFTLAAAPDEVSPLLIKGDLDIACVPANLASVLYNRTEGEIVCLAINTLGVLYIVETGEEIQSMADLAGRTIAASGKGSTPEFALNYLLRENGLDPESDLTIDWKSEHSECVAALASGTVSAALLPQPFVTAAQAKVANLRTALDLTAEWDALDNGSGMVTGVAAARRSFVEEHPAAVQQFLTGYAESVAWVNDTPSEAAELIGAAGIVDASVAEAALPYCNIVCITESGMKDRLSGYLQVLYDASPESVGGAVPGDDFYYGA